jgi:hypothetical protein
MDRTSGIARGSSRNTVREVAAPAAAREFCTLTRIDHEDAWLIEIGSPDGRTAEQWARAILEDAPLTTRTSLLAGWSALGLKVGRDRSGPSVLGWPVRAGTPDIVLLGAGSHIGMPGQLLVKRERDGLLFCTFVHHHNHVARAVWAAVEAAHMRVVRDVLEEAGRRLRSTGPEARA